ncbi:MAG: metallophosphoesterase family protein [Deltaproteobacteria bacterium]|nr:metallophosphoesterase family protein [Deltaproteobacteria bacterium]
MGRLALVADTHSYQAGLPRLLAFFQRQGLSDLACLGDCPPEPFQPWLDLDPRHRLYWAYDFHGPQMPAATLNGMALALPGQVFIAHTRALLWSHFKDVIHAYERQPPRGRPPLLLCHGHTHVPSVTLFRPPASRLLYIHDFLRPQEFQPRQACLRLEPDSIYLIVPGAFTLEENRHPTFSFAVLDLPTRRLVMTSLKDLSALDTLELFD